ncbi:MAG: hypothetical protein GY820_18305 [Gammaproteobacteria bacterium]|nr:hypothetical protein [Gammaproteobacteria bacterium]
MFKAIFDEISSEQAEHEKANVIEGETSAAGSEECAEVSPALYAAEAKTDVPQTEKFRDVYSSILRKKTKSRYVKIALCQWPALGF